MKTSQDIYTTLRGAKVINFDHMTMWATGHLQWMTHSTELEAIKCL